MPVLLDIPPEVFLENENLLPGMPVRDVLHLASTCKFFAALGSDNTLWKHRLQTDFNFSGSGTARTSGWKFIYQGLFNPRVFVWGEKSRGRLGLTRFPKTTIPQVPFPTQLRFPGARIVSLVSGGMSFHALDSEGNIFVWGTLDGTVYTLKSDGYSESGKTASTPMRLRMPAPARSISCGRLHSSTLDANNDIWTFISWGRPFRLVTPLLSAPYTKPAQVECGWHFSAVLTQDGDVFVWWPFSGSIESVVRSRFEAWDAEKANRAVSESDTIPCAHWDLPVDPFRLPGLPPLPDLLDPETEEAQKETRVIKIACFDCHLVGLTNKGHVLKYNTLEEQTTAERGAWEYLPQYSEVERVRQLPAFFNGGLEPPSTMRITHISAHFQKFIAFSTGSSSIVLMGDTGTTGETDPEIVPDLQHKSVISVVLGDYHYGALTSTGKLLTWGAYSNGALGLGDPAALPIGAPGGYASEEHRRLCVERGRGEPPRVETPSEVRFDHKRKKPKDRFVVSATAAGWQMGALVIDLETDEYDTESEESEVEDAYQTRNRWPRRQHHIGEGGQMPILPVPNQDPSEQAFRGGSHVFRIGYAGRGMMPRGRAFGRGGPPQPDT